MTNATNPALTSIGRHLGDYIKRQGGTTPSPQALQGVVADLAVGQPDLQAPLRDLVGRQGFSALLTYSRSGGGLIQRDALIQEISRIYHPDVLIRVEQVLNGFLDVSGGIAISLMQDQSAVQPEKAGRNNTEQMLNPLNREKLKHAVTTPNPIAASTTAYEQFSLIKSYRDFWIKSFAFGGKTKRLDYWLCVAGQSIVVVLLITIGVFIIALSPEMTDESAGILIVGPLLTYTFAGIIPSISLHARRLRDSGFNSWLLLFWLIPYVGGIIIFIFTLYPTKTRI